MKNRIISLFLTLTLLPFFGYSNNAQVQKSTDTQLLTHLYTTKADFQLALEEVTKIGKFPIITEKKDKLNLAQHFATWAIDEFYKDPNIKEYIQLMITPTFNLICDQKITLEQMLVNPSTIVIADNIDLIASVTSFLESNHKQYCVEYLNGNNIQVFTNPKFQYFAMRSLLGMACFKMLLEITENTIKTVENKHSRIHNTYCYIKSKFHTSLERRMEQELSKPIL